MPVDVLTLNTAVTDLRRPDFEFADELVGKGGLTKCKNEDMPKYTQEQIQGWIQQGYATAGGCGNNAPLMARAGLDVAVGAFLGKGKYDGFDAQGKFFYDVMEKNGVDVSAIIKHPNLPTGTTFIHQTPGKDRGGIAYFPNANDDFDLGHARGLVGMFEPEIVYYMYSGLSDKGDANEGKDLANFIKWCREEKNIVTIVDSHTLTGNPQEIIKSGRALHEYKLLEPLLPELSIFFTSSDEAKMIANTLDGFRKFIARDEYGQILSFLNDLRIKYTPREGGRTRLFGVTCSDGAYYTVMGPDGKVQYAEKVDSKFLVGDVESLVGAGDSFRAGLLTYIAKNLNEFKDGTMQFEEAVQMGNLFATLFVNAPLNDRYSNIRDFDTMLRIVKSGKTYETLDQLKFDLDPVDGT